jgi:hypothetical protein
MNDDRASISRIGVVVTVLGILSTLLTIYALMMSLAFAGLYGGVPEEVLLRPALAATGSLAFLGVGFYLVRPTAGRNRTAFISVLVAPIAIIWLWCVFGVAYGYVLKFF